MTAWPIRLSWVWPIRRSAACFLSCVCVCVIHYHMLPLTLLVLLILLGVPDQGRMSELPFQTNSGSDLARPCLLAATALALRQDLLADCYTDRQPRSGTEMCHVHTHVCIHALCVNSMYVLVGSVHSLGSMAACRMI